MAKFPNAPASERLDGLICLREETKTVNHKQVMCFVFRHDLFHNVELHCVRRWSRVLEEGSPEHYFADDTVTEEPSAEEEQGELELPTLEGNEYDVFRPQAEGYEIDDDNEPAPENAPLLLPHPSTLALYMVTGGSLVYARDGQRALEPMLLVSKGIF